MTVTSRGSELDKLVSVFAEKMRESCVDSHYNAKYFVRFNPNDAVKPQDAPRDDTFWGNALTRVILLPIWLPYWFWTRKQKKSEMTKFVVAGTSGSHVDDELMRRLVSEWVGLHPRDFILGEYDPKVAELQSIFEKIWKISNADTKH